MSFGIQINQQPNAALQRAKRFTLPQFGSPSQSINQANSEVMQGAAQTPSNDIYSGAKQGIEKIKTGILNATGGADAVPALIAGQVPQTVDPNTPDAQVGKPQTGIKTGISGQDMENESANMVRGALQAKSPDLEALRTATATQADAQRALAEFDPTKQPVSKLRKAAGIASGLATGILGHGGVEGGIKEYQNITRAPAMEQQQQLARKASAAGVNQASAEKVAQAADKFSNTGKGLADTMQNIAKDTSVNEQYNQTGKSAAEAKTGLDIAQTNKVNQEISRPPKPEINTQTPGTTLIKTGLNPATNAYESTPIAGGGGAQNLTETHEMIARGAAQSAKLDPNQVIDGYRKGDPQMSAFVKEAVDKWEKSHDSSTTPSTSQIQQFYDELNQPHTFEYVPGKGTTGSITPIDEKKVGIEGMTKGKAAPNLGAVEENAYRNAKLAQETIPDAISEIAGMKDKLGALQGRVKNFMVDNVGTYDPQFGALQTTLKNLSVFLAATHTGRFTTPLMKEFEQALGNVHQDPDTLIAKIKEMNKSVQRVQGEIEKANPGSAQVRASNAGKMKVGDVKTLANGKQIKITAVHDDGSFDGDEVKAPVGKK